MFASLAKKGKGSLRNRSFETHPLECKAEAKGGIFCYLFVFNGKILQFNVRRLRKLNKKGYGLEAKNPRNPLKTMDLRGFIYEW
jgi:hypothetical protein